MKLIVEGKPADMAVSCVGDLLRDRPDGTIALVNGRHMEPDRHLKDGDSVCFMEGGREFVAKASGTLLSERYSRPVYERLAKARIGVAGLGGIGSHVAEALVRAGVGHIVIADFDEVDQTNLNRQNYSRRDIGKTKAEATLRILKDIDPDADIVAHCVKVTPDNVLGIFSTCDIVCEAFDTPTAKAMLVESILSLDMDIKVVSCSGMAGFDSSNTVSTVRRMERLYVCGDGVSDASEGAGLVASRVMVCAGHVAHMAIRLALSRSEP